MILSIIRATPLLSRSLLKFPSAFFANSAGDDQFQAFKQRMMARKSARRAKNEGVNTQDNFEEEVKADMRKFERDSERANMFSRAREAPKEFREERKLNRKDLFDEGVMEEEYPRNRPQRSQEKDRFGSRKFDDKGPTRGSDRGSSRGSTRDFDNDFDKDFDREPDRRPDRRFDKKPGKRFDRDTGRGFGRDADREFDRDPDRWSDRGFDKGPDRRGDRKPRDRREFDRVQPSNSKEYERRERRDYSPRRDNYSSERDSRAPRNERFEDNRFGKKFTEQRYQKEYEDDRRGNEVDKRPRRASREEYREDDEFERPPRGMKRVTLKKHEGTKKSSRDEGNSPLKPTANLAEIQSRNPQELLSALGSREYCTKAEAGTLLDIIQCLTTNPKFQLPVNQSNEILQALQSILSKEQIKSLNAKQLSDVILLLLNNELGDKKFWTSIVKEVLSRKETSTLADAIEVLVALKRAKSFITPFVDTDAIFDGYEDTIIKNLSNGKLSPKLLQKTVKTYAQVDKGTKDFYEKLESLVLANFDNLSERIKADILVSFSNAKNVDDKFFAEVKDKVFEIVESKKIAADNVPDKDSITSSVFTKFLLSYHNRKLLDQAILQKAEAKLLEMYEAFYIANIPVLYSIFVKSIATYDPQKAFKLINDCLIENVKELSIDYVADLFTEWNTANCRLNQEVKDKVATHLAEKLESKKKPPKKPLAQIYENIKDDSSSKLKQSIDVILNSS